MCAIRAADAALWDADDNGRYQVRLRGKHVADTTGRRATRRVLGSFYVDVPVVSDAAPSRVAEVSAAAVRPTASAARSAPHEDDREEEALV